MAFAMVIGRLEGTAQQPEAEFDSAVCIEAGTGQPRACAGPDDALGVQIYDYAGLSAESLRQYAATVAAILGSTGMPVRVEVCRGTGALLTCVIGAPNTLVIRVLSGYARAMKNARREPMGQSYATASGGTLASVYLGSLRQEAEAANISWLTALSYATAHEIGHLLLGAGSHSSRGVMKAAWNRQDFLDMAQNRLRFAPEQARLLADRTASRRAENAAK